MILLRKLTRKSKVGFGKLTNYTVNDAFIIEKQAKLIAAYYNNNRITFTEDILEELCITGDKVIEKPGKCPEKRAEVTKEYYRVLSSRLTDKQKLVKWITKKSFIKRAEKMYEKVCYLRPSFLQHINHGHL